MGIMILITNTGIYQVKNEDGKLIILSKTGTEIPNPDPFIWNIGGPAEVLKRCQKIDIPFEDFLKEHEENKIILREKRAIDRLNGVSEAEAVLNNPASTAREIYSAFSYLNRRGFGWELSDKVFLGDNNLSKLLLSKLHTYTVTPYDDGAVIIKSGRKSYSNHRKFAKAGSILDLLDD